MGLAWTTGLLLCMLTTHLLFGQFGPGLSPARAFYVLRGLEGTILFLVLLLPRPTSRLPQFILAITVLIGATMEALTSICGLAWYWGKTATPQPSGGLLCDAAHPQTIAWTAVVACLIILIVALRRNE